MNLIKHLAYFQIYINVFDLLFFGAAAMGLTFSLLLWFPKKSGRKTNRLLSLILTTLVSWVVWASCIDIRPESYSLPRNGVPLQFLLVLGPLLFFYVRSIIKPQQKFIVKDLLHFVPFLLAQGIQLIQSVYTADVSPVYKLWNSILQLLACISVVIYLYKSKQLIKYPGRGASISRYELQWLRRLLFGFDLLLVVLAFYVVIGLLFYNSGLSVHAWYPFYLLLSAIIVWISAEAFLKPESKKIEISGRELSAPQSLSPDKLIQRGYWLRHQMKVNRYYLDAELTSNSLAKKLGISIHELSRIINTGLRKNFNDFVNEFRIKDVALKMKDPAYDRITLLGIAYDCGFNSKTTFNRAFKENTGKSPAEYKRKLKKGRPNHDLELLSGTTTIISCHNTIPDWSGEKLNRNYMFRNYLKIAWRNMLYNKVYSALNIVGLATGMAVALLIGLWVSYQYSYDRFLPDYKQAYQVEMNLTSQHDGTTTQTSIALPLVKVLREEIPGVKYVTETDNMGRMNHDLLVGDKKLYLGGGAAGADFFKIFQYPFVKGNANSALTDMYSIVLTESTAKALFGDADPMGKMVRFDNVQNMKVTGVIKDIPKNASMQFNYITPFAYSEATQGWIKEGRTKWTYNSFSAYVALEPGASYAQLAPKIRNIVNKRSPEMRTLKPAVFMHPLKDWHLYNDFKNGKVAGGFVDYVRLFSIIGILVLAIACINFMNLSTARSEKRAREVGVRKAIGSGRIDLVYQFLLESVLITSISFLLGLLFVQLALPSFNTLTGSYISIPYDNVIFWCIMIGFVLLTGLAAGSRPAFYLSAFNPVRVLKGSIQAGKAATLPRKILVVAQFTCSIALIISTVIVYQQIQFVKNRPTGYSADRLVMTDMNGDLYQHYDALRNELLSSGLVESVASSTSPATQVYSHFSLEKWPGKLAGEETVNIGAIWISDDYFKTMGMTFAAGHNFTGDWKSDTLNVVVNEAMVRRIGLKDPINQLIKINFGNTPVRIIGVVKDALMDSPYTPVAPAVFGHNPFGSVITYRLQKNADTHTAIEKIGKVFERYNPAYPYQYKFVDEEYASKFNLEVLVGKLAGTFATLAIFISCLGLFGLAAYVAEQRTKEIGIRKVLGASIAQVWMMLSRDFVVLVLISCVIASPLALYFLSNWLQKYEYHVKIGPGVFIASAVAALIITLFTISFQAIKAALTNPVRSLRSE
nr:ABC-type antimicrobial peptide transport system permease subunit/AraC-like DNA-binding protein [Mucilaginibacter sp. X4EP1]